MIRSLVTLALLCLPLPAVAQEWALDGMDPVAYQTDGSAVPGRSNLVTLWRGQSWHFASEHNRTLFEANPQSFAPALGGLCPVALSEGRVEPGDPEYFAVVDGHTYLLRSDRAHERLIADPQQVLSRAKENWAKIKR